MGVTFTIVVNHEQFSFSKLTEITDEILQRQISNRLLLWSQSVREAAICKEIADNYGQDVANHSVIKFLNPTDTENIK